MLFDNCLEFGRTVGGVSNSQVMIGLTQRLEVATHDLWAILGQRRNVAVKNQSYQDVLLVCLQCDVTDHHAGCGDGLPTNIAISSTLISHAIC